MAIVASDASNGADGSFSFSSTVCGSTAFALSMLASRLANGEAISLLCTRLKDDTTSSASIAEPSWNLTPGWSLNV